MALTLDCGDTIVVRGATEWVAYTATTAELKFAYASTTVHWTASSGLTEVKDTQWPATYSAILLVRAAVPDSLAGRATALVPHEAAKRLPTTVAATANVRRIRFVLVMPDAVLLGVSAASSKMECCSRNTPVLWH